MGYQNRSVQKFSVLCLFAISFLFFTPIAANAAPVTYNIIYTAISGTGSGAGTVTFDDSLITPNNSTTNLNDLISLNVTFTGLSGYSSPVTFTKSDLFQWRFSTDSSGDIDDINFWFNSAGGYELTGCDPFRLCHRDPAGAPLAEYDAQISMEQIPTLNQWGIITLSIILAASAFLILRRKIRAS